MNKCFKNLIRLGFIKLDGDKVMVRTGATKLEVGGGCMDLHYERLGHMDSAMPEGVAISLAHYFVQNGDMCCDPDMVIEIIPSKRIARSYSFQQAIPPVYTEGNSKSMDSFLTQWLDNLVNLI